MSHACEVRFRSFPGGNPQNMSIELPDSVDVDDAAAVRTYVDAEVSRRVRAGHLAPGEVSYDIYVDKNNTAGFQNDEKLGFGADRQTLAWGAAARHPLTANIRAMRGDVLSAAVSGLDGEDLDPETPDNQTIPAASLSGLDYTADGAEGVGESEARSLLTRFQGIFPNTDSGHRQLFEAYRRNPQVRFGPAPSDTMSLQDVYRTANVSPPDGTTRPQIPSAPGSATDPNAPAADDDQGTVVDNFISNPTPENLGRINRERAKADQLIAMYLAALMSGNLEVLMPLMDLISRKSGLTVAEIGARTARLLGESDQQAAQIGRDLEAINMGSTDQSVRARSNQQMQALQLRLQTNTQGRQQLVGMLQQIMGANENISSTSQALRSAYERMRQAGQMR